MHARYWRTCLGSAAACMVIVACSGGNGDISVTGPGPGDDEQPFPETPSGENPFTGSCETVVTCETLGATCGDLLDNCGETINCDNGEQDGAETDVDCGGGNDTCTRLCQDGQNCESEGDCQSGFCVDGVCCNEACDGDCMTCTDQGLGSCQQVQFLGEDEDTCTAPNACSANAECLLAPGEPCTLDSECASNDCPAGVGGGATNDTCN